MASPSTNPAMTTSAAGEETPSREAPPAAVEGEKRDPQSTREEAATELFKQSISAGLQQPMREDQVQNAVKFLSHPKVRGSPVIYRRSFLEKKGLTREEIDEAFRRVPDPSPNASGAETAKPFQSETPKPAANLQPQAHTQHNQTSVVPTSVNPTTPALKKSIQWSPIFLAVGVLATAGAGSALVFKTIVLPRLKAWIRKVAKDADDDEKKAKSGPSLAEEAADAAKNAAFAASAVAKACENLLSARSEDKKYFEAFMGLIDSQTKEMKSLGTAIRNLEATREVINPQEKQIANSQTAWGNGSTNNIRAIPNMERSDQRLSSTPQERKMNGAVDVRGASAPPSMETTATPYPKSFMEIMAMVQRGEAPPGIKDINDMPPNPNQQPSDPLLVPRVKPWETALQSQQNPYGQTLGRADGPISGAHESGHSTQVNGKSSDSSEAWWKQKSQISEIDDGDEPKAYGIGSKNWPGREWVPPQTPSVAIPEAAAAIRKPKPPIQKQQPVAESSRDGREEETAATTDSVAGASSSNDTVTVSGTSLVSEIQEEPVEDAVSVN